MPLSHSIFFINVTLFSQILNLIDRNLFTKTVEKYKTDKHNKGINSWTHLVTMLFCHFSKAQSLRKITNGLMSIAGNLNAAIAFYLFYFL